MGVQDLAGRAPTDTDMVLDHNFDEFFAGFLVVGHVLGGGIDRREERVRSTM
jgi:hypothetical protein